MDQIAIQMPEQQHNHFATPVILSVLAKAMKEAPKFSGTNHDDVEHWLFEIAETFDIIDLNSSQRLQLIPLYLDGEAKNWWRLNKDSIHSWPEFMSTIANVFRGSDQHSLSFHKLNNHKQRSDESVIEYYNMMIKLCNQTDPNMADTSKLNYLQMDLKQSLQNDVFRRHPSTAAQFFQVAQEEESLQTIVRTYAALTASVFIDPLKSKAEPEASISSVQCSPQKPSARPAPYHQNSSATKSYNPPHYSQLTNRTHTPKKASPRCFGCGKVGHFVHTCIQHPPKRACYRTSPSLIYIGVFVNGKRIRALVDTGATHSFITQGTLG
ncbi:unnamed protein product [Didymodactylos carnosus]|uniref:CCHC-type domain-containing protein n=1 Tax=Didymodactylos carnosus TaxID=1234261 RepID=A0A8S2FNB6_9BILA|nr:unnamed protein product [Didymodactylos carnosus]CAF4303653.1 unnamed protein product [Didymodactylos carnosus]